MANWQCIKNCGACCYLEPEERPDLEEYLDSEQLAMYLSMVGEDGWCIHFDKTTKECRIYEERPRFCRVLPETFQEMYGIEPEELNDFAIDCCHEQIASVYGESSEEMERYQLQVG